MKYWQVYWKLFIELFIKLFSSIPFRKCILESSGATTQHVRKMRLRIQLVLGLMLLYPAKRTDGSRPGFVEGSEKAFLDFNI